MNIQPKLSHYHLLHSAQIYLMANYETAIDEVVSSVLINLYTVHLQSQLAPFYMIYYSNNFCSTFFSQQTVLSEDKKLLKTRSPSTKSYLQCAFFACKLFWPFAPIVYCPYFCLWCLTVAHRLKGSQI